MKTKTQNSILGILFLLIGCAFDKTNLGSVVFFTTGLILVSLGATAKE